MSLPNWLHTRYLALADKFSTDSFGFDDAAILLFERFGDKEDQVKIIMSELGKNKYLEVTRSKEDSRKKIYKAVSLAEATENGKLSRNDIDRVLKKAADLIRTRVDYSFILLLLFYKRFSDQWNVEYKKAYSEALADGFSEAEAHEEAKKSAYHRINIPEEYLWDSIRKNTQTISENFSQAIKALSDLNPTLKETFQQFDFSDFIRNPENSEMLRQLVELFSSYSLENVSPDVLGDAYEWTLRLFAPQKAKEGEVYTPREVIQLMVELLDPKEQESVYDPACGSAGMLIAAYKHVEQKNSKKKADSLFLYGQEQNARTLALAKMNLLIHDITNGLLALGDTLRFPKFKEGESFKKFDYVLANPPWNQDGYDENTLKQAEYWRERFPYGFTSMQSADWAWVQHMLTSSKKKLAIILDTGAISRGGKEQVIRKEMVDSDFVEAVIYLPEKLFYNTPSAGIILILNKLKKSERKDKIILINASNEFKEGKPLNSIGLNNISKIVNIYSKFEEVDGISKIIKNSEIAKANYNISPTRYIITKDTKNTFTLDELQFSLNEIENNINLTDEKFKRLLVGVNNIFTSDVKLFPLDSLVDKYIGGGTPSTKNESYWDGDIPWTTTAPISNEQLYLEKGQKNISLEALKRSSSNMIPAYNILLGTRVGVGKVCINKIDIAINQDITAIIPKQDINKKYLVYALRSSFVQKQFQTASRGTTIKGIPRYELNNIFVPIPEEVETQERIAIFLELLEASILRLNEKKNILHSFSETILQNLIPEK